MSDSTIKCDKCDEEFVDSESFESHKEMSHENDSFQFIDSRNAVDEEEFVRRNSTKGYNPNPNAGLYDNKLFREGSAKERTSILGEAEDEKKYDAFGNIDEDGFTKGHWAELQDDLDSQDEYDRKVKRWREQGLTDDEIRVKLQGGEHYDGTDHEEATEVDGYTVLDKDGDETPSWYESDNLSDAKREADRVSGSVIEVPSFGGVIDKEVGNIVYRSGEAKANEFTQSGGKWYGKWNDLDPDMKHQVAMHHRLGGGDSGVNFEDLSEEEKDEYAIGYVLQLKMGNAWGVESKATERQPSDGNDYWKNTYILPTGDGAYARCTICGADVDTLTTDGDWMSDKEMLDHYDDHVSRGQITLYGESYAKEDDYKYDFDELSSLAQDKIEDGHISQLEWDDSSKEERKDLESVLHGDESDEDGTMLHGSGWNSGAETEPIESNDYLEARDQAISKALKAPIEVEDDYEKVDYEKEDELSAGFIEEQHTERTEDKNKFLDDIDISLENIDYVYPTKIGEAIGKSYITEAIEGLDEEYEGLEDSDEEEVIELVTERKMGGFSNESIARELHITYGVSPEYALSRVHGIEVSTNDKVANTFFGKKYKDCTESEKDELRMYSGSDY